MGLRFSMLYCIGSYFCLSFLGNWSLWLYSWNFCNVGISSSDTLAYTKTKIFSRKGHKLRLVLLKWLVALWVVGNVNFQLIMACIVIRIIKPFQIVPHPLVLLGRRFNTKWGSTDLQMQLTILSSSVSHCAFLLVSDDSGSIVGLRTVPST